MNIDDIQFMVEYNTWANTLMLTMAEQLAPEQVMQKNPLFSFGSLHGTLFHTYDSEYSWRILCQHNRIVFDTMKIADSPDLLALKSNWNAEMDAWRAYLDTLTDADMQRIVTYEVEAGTRNRVLWHCLWHVVNHGMQHRSECAVMLTDFGQSPGGLDVTRFLNERKR